VRGTCGRSEENLYSRRWERTGAGVLHQLGCIAQRVQDRPTQNEARATLNACFR